MVADTFWFGFSTGVFRLTLELRKKIECVCVPDEDVDSLAVVSAKHNVGRTQEGLQYVDQTRRHLLHLLEKEDGASALRQVPLHPALQLLLQTKGGEFSRDMSSKGCQ